jgi:glutathione S-transferase
MPAWTVHTGASRAMAIRIWGRTSSSNVKKVLWLADELKLNYEHIGAGTKFGEIDTPEYRKLNPNARVPTLQDGDFVLWESNSVMRYLAMQYGGEAFYPPDPAARANIDRWLDWQLTTVGPLDVPVFWGTIRTPPEKRDQAAIAANTQKLAAVWKILDEQLVTRAYAASNHFSLADIALGTLAYRFFANPFISPPPLPHIAAWLDRLRQRPPFKKHVEVPLE